MKVRKTGNARKVWDLAKSFAGTIEKTGGLTYDKKKSSEKRMGAETVLKRGPLNVLACYVLWGILPLFWPCLGELSPLCVLGYRILFSLVAVGGYLLLARRWEEVRAVLRNRREAGRLAVSGLLIAVNWGSYIWAANSGHVLDASLAYYMYPILSILIGTLFFRERLGPLQWAAVVLMAVGVAVTAVGYGSFPWLALVIGGSFVLYSVVKRRVTCDSAVSLLMESLATLPLALLFIAAAEAAGRGAAAALRGWQLLLLPAAGVVTAVPLLFFSRGIRETPYALAGVLMLVNPTLQLLVGVFCMGEAFTASHAVLFAFVWTGLALFLAGDVLAHRRKEHEKS